LAQTDRLYLGDLLERNLNLYFTAGGRYYDPWLGKHLQPDAIGGPPTLPQAADRYQYAGNSPTGVGRVATAWGGGVLQTTLSAIPSESLESGLGMAISACARATGYLYVQANEALLGRAGYRSLFTRMSAPGRGRSAWYISRGVTPGARRTYRVLGTDEVIDLDVLEAAVRSRRWPVRYPLDEPFAALDDAAFKRWLRSPRGEFWSGFAIEMAFAVPELTEPWGNPYFNTEGVPEFRTSQKLW
ncbi:MAG: hypothetical protein U9R05_03465, partial [Chloroflexota bacterium]|nr:hypothetical protein [Chloroflexota bacterium]